MPVWKCSFRFSCERLRLSDSASCEAPNEWSGFLRMMFCIWLMKPLSDIVVPGHNLMPHDLWSVMLSVLEVFVKAGELEAMLMAFAGEALRTAWSVKTKVERPLNDSGGEVWFNTRPRSWWQGGVNSQLLCWYRLRWLWLMRNRYTRFCNASWKTGRDVFQRFVLHCTWQLFTR